ncbi:CHAT domain-containing tetratricopeptide repeat protein [Sphingorhabdus sp. SMR4y]|uniref:CHAT domain-containing tetratricopeptide repeat protein n=1 Tax=Sphingorhabdus sp. SMR4y TaxID=2584094 RepID=UPI000B5C9FC7|nr:CHAT domain-containing tetratricopeptide repeat protein [Sphingorhabdus sp. SMR4y]ASK87097.1 CHAT domain protein [Sphingorhabdus sp. SMR4y]
MAFRYWKVALLLSAGSLSGIAQANDDVTLNDRMTALVDRDVSRQPNVAIKEIKAMLEASESGDEVGTLARAAAFGALGGAYFYLQDFEQSLANFRTAEALLDADNLHTHKQMISILNNISVVLSMTGKAEEALSIQQKVLDIRRETEGMESSGYAAALFNIGSTKYRLGDYQSAVTEIRQAVDIARVIENPTDADNTLAVTYWMSLAAVVNATGDTELSLKENRLATQYAEDRLGERHSVYAGALNNLGSALSSAGRCGEAIPLLRRALDLRTEILGRDKRDTAITLTNLADCLAKTEPSLDQVAMFDEAARIFESSPGNSQSRYTGNSLAKAGLLSTRLGQLEQGQTYLEKALAATLSALSDNHPAVAELRLELVNNHLLNENYDAAQSIMTEIATQEDVIAKFPVAEKFKFAVMRTELANAFGHPDNKSSEAIAAYRAVRRKILDRAVSIEEYFADDTGLTDQFARFAGIMAREKNMAESFDAMQLAQFADLSSISGSLTARSVAEKAGLGDEVRQLQDLVQNGKKIDASFTKATTEGDKPKQAALLREREENSAAIAELSARIETALPEYWSLAKPEPVALGALQSALKSAPLLMVTPALDGVYVAAVTKNDYVWQKTTVRPGQLNQWVRDIRNSVSQMDGPPSPFAVESAHALYRYYVPSGVEKLLRDEHEIHLISSGILAALPASLLITEPVTERTADADIAWLIKRFAVSNPMSVADLVQPPAARDREIRFAGFGAPALSGAKGEPVVVASLLRSGNVDISEVRDLPSLPSATLELTKIGDALGRNHSRVITGNAATEALIKTMDLRPYSVLAFATHGLVNGELRGLGEPALVFTPPQTDDGTDDGLLTASEIGQLRLDADWVILSACNSAAGSGVGTPTYSGLAKSFAYAGARSLLLSHWRVRDDAAARLTVDTVSNAAGGKSRAEALRQAQLDLMNDPTVPGASHPAVWAPFILIGD